MFKITNKYLVSNLKNNTLNNFKNYYSNINRLQISNFSFKTTKNSSNNKLEKLPMLQLSYNHSFYKLNSSSFTKQNKIANEDNLKKQETLNEQNEKLLHEFEDMLNTKEDNPEKRIKLLSIKLLQASSSQEVLNLFIDKYIKALVEKIYSEELCLFLYFYVSLLDKEPELHHNISKQLNDSTLITKIFEQIEEMDLTNIFVLSWSCSLLISKFKYDIPIQLRVAILQKLPDELEVDRKAEIPTICFGISAFYNKSETE